MSRARHAEGGKIEPELKTKPYNAVGSHVLEEAEEKKKGGRIGRKTGGRTMEAEGKHSRPRMDRPGRKRGGSVGADMHPLSTAARITNAQDHDADAGNAEDGP